jgi:hypothetical protein
MNAPNLLAKVLGFGRTSMPIRPKRYARLELEALEERAVPTTDNIWIGPAGGNLFFGNPANWTLGHVPRPGEIAACDPGMGGSNSNCVVNGAYSMAEFKETITYSGTLDLLSFSSLTADAQITTWAPVIMETGPVSISTGGNWYQYSDTTCMGAGNSVTALNWAINGGSLTVRGTGMVTDLTVNGYLFDYGPTFIGTPSYPSARVVLTGAAAGHSFSGSTVIMRLTSTLTDNSGMPLTLNAGATLDMQGATINSTGGVDNATTIITESGRDSINGGGPFALRNSGGTIQWGGGPHRFLIGGNFVDFLGTLTGIRLGAFGGGANDGLDVTGTATLTSTSVNATAPFGFLTPTPLVGTWLPFWNPITTAGGITGTLGNITLPPPPPGESWVVTFTANPFSAFTGLGGPSLIFGFSNP